MTILEAPWEEYEYYYLVIRARRAVKASGPQASLISVSERTKARWSLG